MTKEIKRFEPRKNRLSEVSVYNGVVYLAGVTASDRTQDVAGQTKQVLQRIDELLHIGGSSKEHILVAQVWLKRQADFAAMNAVWDRWISPASLPGRATLIGDLADEAILVEILIQAAVQESS